MTIRQLPERLANKIAAGEVVERPASVVKELIENSIDAISTEITIILKEAGLQRIQVIDNGDGMSQDNCMRAFLRHATSKIEFDADLFRIQTLGFRGEALASIASVSKVTLKSSKGDNAGTELYIEGGELIREGKCSARKGTEIVVEQLFYNTPARLKYVRSIHTELGHITDLVNRYALAQPTIRFQLIHNDRQLFTSAGTGNVLQVIAQIYGRQVAGNMFQIEGKSLDFTINGYIAKPDITRANRNYITCIVNGRYIKNYAITQAVLRAYDTLLPLHRFPIVMLDITLDPILVDVNVHPTKLEVRFSKEKELIQLIEQTIRSTFRKQQLIPEIKLTDDSIETKKSTKQSVEQPMFSFERIREVPKEIAPKETRMQDKPKVEKDEKREALEEHLQVEQQRDTRVEEQCESERERRERIPTLYTIGQFQETYILAQNEHGFYMIDQHAAQERIKYEYYKQKLQNPTIELQHLLIPLTFEFTTTEVSFINEHKASFEKVGLFLESFGGQTYTIRSYPNWFPAGLEESLIREFIAQVIEHGKIDISLVREELAITMACKRSIKANHYLTTDEMEHLVEDLRKTADPFTCPHGRPVILHFSTYEIEKMFKRIM